MFLPSSALNALRSLVQALPDNDTLLALLQPFLPLLAFVGALLVIIGAGWWSSWHQRSRPVRLPVLCIGLGLSLVVGMILALGGRDLIGALVAMLYLGSPCLVPVGLLLFLTGLISGLTGRDDTWPERLALIGFCLTLGPILLWTLFPLRFSLPIM